MVLVDEAWRGRGWVRARMTRAGIPGPTTRPHGATGQESPRAGALCVDGVRRRVPVISLSWPARGCRRGAMRTAFAARLEGRPARHRPYRDQDGSGALARTPGRGATGGPPRLGPRRPGRRPPDGPAGARATRIRPCIAGPEAGRALPAEAFQTYDGEPVLVDVSDDHAASRAMVDAAGLTVQRHPCGCHGASRS
jgi:hypothetical protein